MSAENPVIIQTSPDARLTGFTILAVLMPMLAYHPVAVERHMELVFVGQGIIYALLAIAWRLK